MIFSMMCLIVRNTAPPPLPSKAGNSAYRNLLSYPVLGESLPTKGKSCKIWKAEVTKKPFCPKGHEAR